MSDLFSGKANIGVFESNGNGLKFGEDRFTFSGKNFTTQMDFSISPTTGALGFKVSGGCA